MKKILMIAAAGIISSTAFALNKGGISTLKGSKHPVVQEGGKVTSKKGKPGPKAKKITVRPGKKQAAPAPKLEKK